MTGLLLSYLLLWIVSVSYTIYFTRRYSGLQYSPMTYYLIFHWLVFVLRPLFVITGVFFRNFDYMRFTPSVDDHAKAFLVITAALAAMALGYELAGNRRASQMILDYSDPRRLWKTVIIAAIPLLPISLYSISEGVGGIAIEQVGEVYVMTGSSGYLVVAHIAMFSVTVLICALGRFQWWSWVPIGTYLAYVAAFMVSRWLLVTGFMSVAILYSAYSRRLPLKKILFIAPILLAFFLYKGRLRAGYMEKYGGEVKASRTVEDVHVDVMRLADNQDFGCYDYLVYITSAVPHYSGTFTYFTQWAQLFTEPIPRSLWKNKPVGAPIQYLNLNDYGNFSGLTNSMAGDGWLSYGFVGVFVTGGLSGYILGRMQRQFFARPRSLIACTIYAIFLGTIHQYYRDGGISIFKFCFFTLYGLFVVRLVYWILERFDGQVTPGALPPRPAPPA